MIATPTSSCATRSGVGGKSSLLRSERVYWDRGELESHSWHDRGRGALERRDSLLRPAEPSDIRSLFEWRNDPLIVSVSSSGQGVSWEEHERWFSSVLGSSEHLLYIVNSHHAVPVGMVRLDRK